MEKTISFIKGLICRISNFIKKIPIIGWIYKIILIPIRFIKKIWCWFKLLLGKIIKIIGDIFKFIGRIISKIVG